MLYDISPTRTQAPAIVADRVAVRDKRHEAL